VITIILIQSIYVSTNSEICNLIILAYIRILEACSKLSFRYMMKEVVVVVAKVVGVPLPRPLHPPQLVHPMILFSLGNLMGINSE
jgi:hypothetical protein